MDLGRLRMLRELDALGTIAAAAEALGYTPSAVSQGLSVLEREAGTALLERAGRGVRLTAAGRVLAAHAVTLLAAAEEAEAGVARAAGTVAGTVRVAAFQTALLHLVIPAAAAITRSHPEVRVEVLEAEVEASLPALRRGRVDVLVQDEYDGLPRERHADLDRTTLLREEVRLWMPGEERRRARRPSLAALADAPWAAAHPGTGHHAMVVRTCRELGGFEPDVRHESNDLLVLRELVRTAGAVTLLPELVGTPGPGVVTATATEGAVHRDVHALTRRSGRARPALAVTLDALAEAARAARRT